MADLPFQYEQGYGPGFLEWLKTLPSRQANVVTAYGADPTGATDSGPAFNQAWSDALSAGGRVKIIVPCGTYRWTTPVVVTGPNGSHAHQFVSMESDGWGTAVIWPGTAGMTMLTIQSAMVADFTHFYRIKGLTFDASSEGGPGIAANTAIDLIDVSHFQITGTTFTGFAVSGQNIVQSTRCAWGQMHENNWARNGEGTTCLAILAPNSSNANFGHFVSSSLFGPFNSNCMFIGEFAEGTIIEGCHFAFHETGTSIEVRGFEQTIANNYIYPHDPSKGFGVAPSGLEQKGVVINGGRQVVVTGNFIENCQEYAGIHVSNDVGLAAIHKPASQIHLRGNTLFEMGQDDPPPSGTGPNPGLPVGMGAIHVAASAGDGIIIGENTFADNEADHHIVVEDLTTPTNKVIIETTNVFVNAPIGTVTNSYATAGPDLFFANLAGNAGIRLQKIWSESEGYMLERQIVGAPNVTGATPNVEGLTHCVLTQPGPGGVLVTNFLGGHVGQSVLVLVADNLSTLDFTVAGNLIGNLNAGVNWNPAPGDAFRIEYTGTNWICFTPL